MVGTQASIERKIKRMSYKLKGFTKKVKAAFLAEHDLCPFCECPNLTKRYYERSRKIYVRICHSCMGQSEDRITTIYKRPASGEIEKPEEFQQDANLDNYYHSDEPYMQGDPRHDRQENPWIDVFGEGDEAETAYWNTH